MVREQELQAARHAETSRPEDAFERTLERLIGAPDESRLDPAWRQAQVHIQELALRPAKRLRPRLLAMGYGIGRPDAGSPPPALASFAAGLEVLHTFLLIHDDVADHSPLRRGGPTLHRTLAALGAGEDLAVVAGDHLFARSMELLLTTPLPGATAATLYYLGICRHTAVGQYLDLVFSHRPLAEMTPFEALKVAHLKTAKYSFAAPLACGAMLAGAPRSVVATLERIGRLGGLAFQLQDDLIGIIGDPGESGKPSDGDLSEGKRTFPLLFAYQRANAEEREVLDGLQASPTPERIQRAREIICAQGGIRATQRAILRATRSALRTADALPVPKARIEPLTQLLQRLVHRTV